MSCSTLNPVSFSGSLDFGLSIMTSCRKWWWWWGGGAGFHFQVCMTNNDEECTKSMTIKGAGGGALKMPPK